ncbi:hypothetical protein M441DRAFT_88340 [Trichoderma asperellum CBS 433.97]|uniref:Uncharacterized protein n=1 Tax=Trichoderma asperellum (strain ATCC 204424 / CBS 433.97 / NBRC 101777) TaxID=1042311 RepID=A0A2T3ZFN0_TRIA4|nr:hypothetical protein M441DRAFT_88340 [Trichoderma asperellum CBS 433.97]PTB43600.1 hypothetical protein M441DRAFT_88340 [Trichoderma asperellum CBS 433.97]
MSNPGQGFPMGANFQADCRLGESSKRASLLEKREKEARGSKQDLLLLYRESFYEESTEATHTTFEMQPMTPYEGDEEKPRGKGKKKTSKGKAVDRDPGFTCSRNSRKAEKRREVEPEDKQSQVLDISDALAQLRLAYEQEAEKIQAQSPCHEVEDGWMVVKEGIDVWDFTEEVGPLPD